MTIRIKNRDILTGGVLASIAIIMVPFLTLWFGTLEDPFSYTLSMMGNRFDLMTEFIIWGCISGLLILIYVFRLYGKVKFKDIKARRFLILSNVFLVLTVITPAVEEVNALTHKLHFLFAILFAVYLSLSIFFFMKYLKSIDEEVSRKSMFSLLGVVLGSLLILLVFGANAIFEMFFFFALSVLLLFLNSWIKRLEQI